MARIDEMDARARRAIGRQLQEPCTWIPKAKARYAGDQYTTDQATPDDVARPRVPGLVAIVRWRTGAGDTGGGGDGRVASGQLMVDLPLDAFPSGIPVKGDQFELPEQDPGERLVEVTRPNHDGSARLLYWCKVVS